MKQSKTALILVILLLFLLGGGALLYQKLSVPEALPVTNSPAPAENPAASSEAAESEPAVTPEPALEQTADFTVLDEEGNSVSLSDYFGKPIIVNFWATWCPPCRAELPYFDAAAEAYAGEIRFLMVDLTDGYNDTVESATAFAREENAYSFPLFFDVEFSAAEAYRINAIPVTLFIRADGSLMHQQIGSMDEASLQRLIDQLLQES